MTAATFQECIGTGCFGSVYLCAETNAGRQVACKQIELAPITKEEADALEKEVKEMLLLCHPNIVEMYRHERSDSYLTIYVEYVPGGDLSQLIDQRRSLNTPLEDGTISRYLSQLLAAMSYMHRRRLSHRDLKPRNVLLANDNRILKVCDPGVASTYATFASVRNTTLASPDYSAPELITRQCFQHKCDIWSIGVIAYELVELRRPFVGKNYFFVIDKIKNALYPPLSPTVNRELAALITSMLQKNGSQRPDCSEMLQSKLFDPVNDIDQLRRQKPTLQQVWHAAYQGDLKLLQRQLRDATDLGPLVDSLYDTDGPLLRRSTPLMAAAASGHDAVVRWLVMRARPQVDKTGSLQHGRKQIDGVTALMVACRQGHYPVVKVLIEQGRVDVHSTDGSEMTSLMWASYSGDFDTVTSLLIMGVDVNAHDSDGWTALHYAASKGHTGAMGALIYDGAEVNTQDNYLWTPIHLAAQGNHADAISMLTDVGANEEAKQKNKSTPLHVAAICGHLDAIEALLKAGASVNAANQSQLTPIQLAVQHGYCPAVQSLVSAGAMMKRKGRKATPLHLAAYYAHDAVVEFLLPRRNFSVLDRIQALELLAACFVRRGSNQWHRVCPTLSRAIELLQPKDMEEQLRHLAKVSQDERKVRNLADAVWMRMKWTSNLIF